MNKRTANILLIGGGTLIGLGCDIIGHTPGNGWFIGLIIGFLISRVV